jgi:hypothetical protein
MKTEREKLREAIIAILFFVVVVPIYGFFYDYKMKESGRVWKSETSKVKTMSETEIEQIKKSYRNFEKRQELAVLRIAKN